MRRETSPQPAFDAAAFGVDRSRSRSEGADTVIPGQRHPSPRTAAACTLPAYWRKGHDRSGTIRTPRPMRPRVTPAVAGLLARGSFAADRLPGNMRAPSGTLVAASPLTVAGAAAALCASARTAFPFDPLREPPLIILSTDSDSVNIQVRMRPKGSARCGGSATVAHAHGETMRTHVADGVRPVCCACPACAELYSRLTSNRPSAFITAS